MWSFLHIYNHLFSFDAFLCRFTKLHVTVHTCACVLCDSLVILNPDGCLALKLLLLQDALKVLHALIGVFHVSRQVAVEEADAVTEHRHAGANATFIPLQRRRTAR